MRPYLSSLFCAVIAFLLYSCSENNASPIRNVRFDPELLNRSQLTIDPTAAGYSFTQNNLKKHLGTVYTKEVLVNFKSNLSTTEQQKLQNTLGFVKAFGRPVHAGAAIQYSLELIDGLNPVQVEQAIAELQKRPEVTYAAPYFLAGNQLMGISDELKVQIRSKEELQQLEHLLHANNASVTKQLDELSFVVKVDKNTKGNALVLSNLLSEHQGIASAEPAFIKTAL